MSIHHDLHPDHKFKLVYDKRSYTCDGCHGEGFGWRYSCDDPVSSCNFHLHCALPEPTLTHLFLQYLFLQYLFLQSGKETGEGEPCSRQCNACGPIKGFVYHCFDKDCELHPSCATLPNTIIIDYGDKKLVLKPERESSSKCDKFLKGDDGKKFNDIKGDDGKKFDDKIETMAMVKRATEQDLHPDHKIKLVYDERPYICDGCREYGFGSRYSCDDPFSSCNFHLHECCALPEPTLTHPFFPHSEFKFLKSDKETRKPCSRHCNAFAKSFFPNYVFKFLKSDKETRKPCSRHCNACAKSIKGFLYHCFDKDWDLHPSCATLPHTMEIDYGGKMLELKLVRESFSECDKCHKEEFITDRKSWAYVSDDEDFHLHIGCVKDLLCEAWEDKFLKGDDGKRFNDNIEMEAMVKRATEPVLRIVLDEVKKQRDGRLKKFLRIVLGEGKKQRDGRLKKYKVILKFAVSVLFAVFVGDPTGLVVGLISSILH